MNEYGSIAYFNAAYQATGRAIIVRKGKHIGFQKE